MKFSTINRRGLTAFKPSRRELEHRKAVQAAARSRELGTALSRVAQGVPTSAQRPAQAAQDGCA